MSKKEKINDQVEIIRKNRERRFNYLVRNDRMEDAIALGDEFLEWMDPYNRDIIQWFDAEELKDIYDDLVQKNRKKRHRHRK